MPSGVGSTRLHSSVLLAHQLSGALSEGHMERARQLLGWKQRSDLEKTLVAIVAVVGVTLASFGMFTIAMGTSSPLVVVTSGSMSPTLERGHLLIIQKQAPEDIVLGDIIVFKSHIRWPDEKILVHRVSNIITDNKGRIKLETKGDNNEWTDQAGPHIPEPYIREKNLMGKVISIGQFPLKIPFVGYLGIWINEGLNSLSQPTTSKDPLSYAGIFAPLTISVVIMVILIFILPEKAKTVKEKIHLNIFGRRPLNLKRTVIML